MCVMIDPDCEAGVKASAGAFIPPGQFWTDRLWLRVLRLSDARALHKDCTSDPQVTRYLTWTAHQRVAETVTFIKDCLSHHASDQQFVWVVTLRDNGRPIGMVECVMHEESALIGYFLARAHWGKGYATEAAGIIADWAETIVGVGRLWAVCDAENTASIRVLERLGFCRRDILHGQIVCPGLSPLPRDACRYVREAGEYWDFSLDPRSDPEQRRG